MELTSSTHLSSYCSDDWGTLCSLAVTNLDDGTQQVFGLHKKDVDIKSLRESPPLDQSGLALTHLYGSEKKEAWSVCFNIEWANQSIGQIWFWKIDWKTDLGKLIENWFWEKYKISDLSFNTLLLLYYHSHHWNTTNYHLRHHSVTVVSAWFEITNGLQGEMFQYRSLWP